MLGIVGLGRIGLALTRRLVAHGHFPRGYRRGDASTFLEAGGVAATSIEALVADCETILLVLPDVAASSHVIDQILAAAPGARTIVDVTSQPRPKAIANGARLVAMGHAYIEAPLGGTPAAVESGTATFMVGASAEEFRLVQPLLNELASTVLHVGDVGAGSALKSASLLIMTINILAVAEGLAFASSFGVDPVAAVEALQHGAAASNVLRQRGPSMATGDFEAKLGRMADFETMLKDIAASASTPTQLFDRAIGYLEQGIAAGLGEQDIAGLYALIRRP